MTTWKQVLISLKDMSEPIRVGIVRQKFNFTMPESSIRLRRLHEWGYLNFIDRKKRGRGGYGLTTFGLEMIKKLKEGDHNG